MIRKEIARFLGETSIDSGLSWEKTGPEEIAMDLELQSPTQFTIYVPLLSMS
jgi:hypothetical protein